MSAETSGFGIATFQGDRGSRGCIAPGRQNARERMLHLSSRGMFGSGPKKGLSIKGTSAISCGAAKTGTAERARTEEVTG
jgi:hypothetical protein